MRCANCATENAPGNKFCTGCGAALDSRCGQCGRAIPPTARFCGACGTPQAVAVPRVAPQGERKQATVLFVDIVGSTELIAGLDAEQAGQRLQPAVAVMVEAVRRFDGTVLGKTGDGLKAIFGAPRAQEGHALLACQAALAIQAAMARQPDPGPIRIRIGLHSGEVGGPAAGPAFAKVINLTILRGRTPEAVGGETVAVFMLVPNENGDPAAKGAREAIQKFFVDTGKGANPFWQEGRDAGWVGTDLTQW